MQFRISSLTIVAASLFSLNDALALTSNKAYSFAPPTQTKAVSNEKSATNRGASIEYMTGVSDMHGIRLAYRPSVTHSLDLPLIGITRVEYEISVNLFDLHGSAKNEATYGVSFSPTFIKQIPTFNENYPLAVEFGIGVSYVHEEKFGGVDIGSDYQFEDRLGVLMQLGSEGKSQLGLRLIHYSNGGFNTKNPGLDFVSFVYMQRF